MRISFSLFLLFFFFNSYAQKKYVEVLEFSDISQQELKVKLPKPATSVVLFSKDLFEDCTIEFNNQIFIVNTDFHNPTDTGFFSELFIPENAIPDFTLNGRLPKTLRVYAISVPKLDIYLISAKALSDSCEKPFGIDQDVWRNGLTPPSGTPVYNSVNHCIIHHSAGSNTSTDYVNVVRNIYVAHTTVNGWDDIGYNYLIAQDGTLFHGRDSQNLMSDDNVLGAHFCAKNTGTMGICLLGNYVFAAPTQAALDMLEKVILWKVHKESLDPQDSARHPLPGGDYLNTIAGHMDGCATECPGALLYAEIQGLRNRVDSSLVQCEPLVALETENHQIISLTFNNPFKEQLTINALYEGKIQFRDLLGHEMTTIKVSKGKNTFNQINLNRGTYMMEYTSDDASEFYKIIRIN